MIKRTLLFLAATAALTRAAAFGWQQAPAAPPPPPPPESYAPSQNAPPVNTPMRVEAPAGTHIIVRLIDPVNSTKDHVGDTYRASLDEPVVVDGQTMIPRGADAVVMLTDAQQSGKIEGRTVLTLDLKTIRANGRSYDVTTSGIPEASKSRGSRSAKTIGGGAVLGAIIGAAAGGGRGAAIGAGAGAAAGTAAEMATSGQKVKLPAETRLTFLLRDPIEF